MVFKTKILFKLLFWIDGIAIFPFIFIRSGLPDLITKMLVRHELIHLKQQKELFVLPFYFIYILNFIFNYVIKCYNYNTAYEEILFEKEAYDNEIFLNYLSYRKSYAWFKDYV